MLPYFEDATFQCPEETHPIPKAVHLARMASGYHKCATCEHASVPNTESPKIDQNSSTTSGKVRTSNNLRGILDYDWTPESIRWTLSSIVDGTIQANHTADRNRRFQVVVGSDERASSLQLARPSIEHLRLMGCHVTDIGVVTKPVLVFATTYLDASIGIYITGSGNSSSHSGFDVVDQRGLEWDTDTLDAQRSQLPQTKTLRLTRTAGDTRLFDVQIPYLASFLKHFHALRPLRLHCRSCGESVSAILKQLFQSLPCDLSISIEQNSVVENTEEQIDIDSDASFLISEDGTAIQFFDEHGNHVPPPVIHKLIRTIVSKEFSDPIIVTPEMLESHRENETQWIDLQKLAEKTRAVIVSDNKGRWWFPEVSQGPDAVLSLAYILQVLSQNDLSFSKHVSDVAG